MSTDGRKDHNDADDPPLVVAVAAPAAAAAAQPRTRTRMTLAERHEALRKSHFELKGGVVNSVATVLTRHTKSSRTVAAFVNKSMATVAAWMLAQTCFLMITHPMKRLKLEEKVSNLACRIIYAVAMSCIVPLILWLLQKPSNIRNMVLKDQASLINMVAPMCYAWAWKDVIAAILRLQSQTEHPEEYWAIAVATAIVAIVVDTLLYHCPAVRRAIKATTATTAKDGEYTSTVSFCQFLLSMPKSLGLAIGYAWNTVLSYPASELKQKVIARLFKFMLQVVYFLIVTFIITTAFKWWHSADSVEQQRKDKDEADDAPHAEKGDHHKHTLDVSQHAKLNLAQRIKEEESKMVHAAGQNFMTALTFVFAWAQLDLVNDFFFAYLMNCASPTVCSYQSNIGFASAITLVFTRWSFILTSEKRNSAWNQASAELTNMALSLNVGWAWSNYCSTAIASAVSTSGLSKPWTYVICSVFVWFFITVLHYKFEVERRAWDRHVHEETLSQGICQA
mmetsp:Transcript_1553/g.3287  ORF Transcript_1553/g.3287 Transcript_1553/m.3287 type:complete len:507 (+) Transcript_1553:90-1610(+)